MMIEELRRRKKELNLTNQEIADLSGLPLSTVQKILAGVTRSPRYDSIAALEKVLAGPLPERVAESAAAYGVKKEESSPEEPDQKQREGGYTYSDYIALPDDRRVELIDGRFYDMASPNSRHQIIVGQLYVQLYDCIQKHPGCMVLLSPMDVMLDEDDRTVVQPDLMVFCDLKRLRKGRVFGAPDLVIEVVSPGSRRMDYFRKLTKYMEAGVKEYWIVDERKGKVIVYVNHYGEMENNRGAVENRKNSEGGKEPGTGDPNEDQNNGDQSEETPTGPEITIYGMNDDIPVFLSGGDCRIEMEPIRRLLDSLGDI